MEYDSAKDAHDSYYAAVEAKRLRGDTTDWERPWKRFEQIGQCSLYLGDSAAILPYLEAIDAVVTDPPYGIGADKTMHKQSGTQYGKAAAAKREYRETDWDTKPIPVDFMDSVRNVAKWCIIFGGNYYSFPASSCWLVWDKENGDNGFADCELAWTNLPKAVRRIKHMWNGMLRKGGEEREGHPTQKPVGVMQWAIGHLPEPNTTILDPFMGSGTTGIACIKLGKKFVGIEVDEQYFNLACERIRKAYAQPDMFIETARVPEPTQEALSL
jgi:DNA modification methylase